jgi:tetratricopeptide (TPR) repeat protein
VYDACKWLQHRRLSQLKAGWFRLYGLPVFRTRVPANQRVPLKPFQRRRIAIVPLSFVWLLLTVFPSARGLCQGPSPSPSPSKEEREMIFLQERADEFFADILKNLASVDESSQAVFLVYLSRSYWDSKPLIAKGLLARAENTLRKEIDSGDRERIVRSVNALKKVLPTLLTLDERAGLEFSVKTTQTLDEKKGYDSVVADLYASLALDFINKDPVKAIELGRRALLLGQPILMAAVIAKAYVKQPEKAEELFELALVVARRSYSYEFIASLGTDVFGMSGVGNMSDSAKADYLKMLSDMFGSRLAADTTEAEKCSLAPVVKEAVPAFDLYVSSAAEHVRQQLVFCGSDDKTLAELTPDFTGKSADDILQAAHDVRELHTKARLYGLAVARMMKDKQFARIVSMLDQMEASEKDKLSATVWQSWRIEYGSEAALAYMKDKDLPSTYRMIEKSPPDVKPFIRFRLVNSIEVASNREFVLENLQAIRKELLAFDVPTKDAASSYLSLTRLYSRIQPEEAAEVFADAVKLINEVDGENPDSLPQKDYAPMQDYLPMPFQLVNADAGAITGSISNIASKRSRTRIELGLIQACLKRTQELSKVISDQEQQRTRTTNPS